MKNKTPLYRVELCERARGKKRFWWRIRQRNNNILVTSQMYSRKCDRNQVANNMARDAGWPVVEAG